MLFLMVTK